MTTTAKPASTAIGSSTAAPDSPRTMTSSMPSFSQNSGSTWARFCSHCGVTSSGKNEPLRNDIGSTMKLAMFTAPSVVFATAPDSSPIAMKQSVPTISSGMDASQAPVSFSPKNAAPRPRKIAIWVSAMPTVTATRAPTSVLVGTGESCSRRSSLELRQPFRVAAAPKLALIATAQPSRPGVTYWMVLRESSSTWTASSWYVGGLPDRATLVPSTKALSTPWVTAAFTWSVWV